MMMTSPADLELAKLLHEAWERLAPDYIETRFHRDAIAWEDMPDPNKRLMIAVAAEIRKGFT